MEAALEENPQLESDKDTEDSKLEYALHIVCVFSIKAGASLKGDALEQMAEEAEANYDGIAQFFVNKGIITLAQKEFMVKKLSS